jgi:ribose-phosphate pyrophosphokinase
MNYINLVNPELGTHQFKISRFPDGQINAKIGYIKQDPCRIISRFSSYTELMTILSVNQVLRNAGVKYVELYCPYIMSARSDRRFEDYQSFDLKLTSQILNLGKFDKVFIIDPHSDVTPALIENSVPINAFDGWIEKIPESFWKDKVLVSPDAGAFKKIFNIADKLKTDLITGSKIRKHESGELEVVIFGDVSGKDCVIVDDICDGGRTFTLLANKLKGLGAKTVSLVVTHGIFSNGLNLDMIDDIWTTNSYRDFIGNNSNFHVINVY